MSASTGLPGPDGPLSRDDAGRLGVMADALDRFDLMRAIERCDKLVSQVRALQLVHSQNLCRVANHLAAAGIGDQAVSPNLVPSCSHGAGPHSDRCYRERAGR